MKKKLRLIAMCFLILGSVFGQERTCATMENLEYRKQKDPNLEQRMAQIEAFTKTKVQQKQANRIDGNIITIPVVVHVLYSNNTENISESQILSQIDVLNEDFRRTNSDADNTWAQAADTEIQFCLASVDPNGNTTNGITRKSTNRQNWSSNDDMKKSSMGGINPWDTSQYLNMWVVPRIVNQGDELLGYAQFPGGDASTDGVVMAHNYFGRIGEVTSPFDRGRTTTHEVGHFLNLRHIWGDGGCNADDFVSDTPLSDSPNFECTPSHSSCGSTDMVQNYMDYSNDSCMNLFTQGQKDRMRSVLDVGGFRRSLALSDKCNGVTAPTCTDGIQNGNETGIDCGGSCPPCQSGCSENQVSISITFDNYPQDISWNLINSNNQTVASGNSYNSQYAGATYSEELCLPDGCYTFEINDSYGDGICCSTGNGSYTVSNGTEILATLSSSFSSSEQTDFCLGNGNQATCTDGIQNGNETGIDCGGPDCDPCPTIPSCFDGIQNGNETGIDCGGSCPPCQSGCSENQVSISITFDDYPEDISWSLVNSSNQTIASGNSYNNQYAGATYSEELCLPDGCYTFEINDSYGDGICCSVGNGSYTVSNGTEILATLSSSFTSSEQTNFCLGNGTEATCTDGIQNGNETGIDCGGDSCEPCEDIALNLIHEGYFEFGWDGWSDGGNDCRRYYGSRSSEGYFSIALRDNSGTASSMTSESFDLSSYDSVLVTFSFYAHSMEYNEDFLLYFNNGSGWVIVDSWARGFDFSNSDFYSVEVLLEHSQFNFGNNSRFRFQCDASGNGDLVYIDEVIITGVNGNINNTNSRVPQFIRSLDTDYDALGAEDFIIYPNPVKENTLFIKVPETNSKMTYRVLNMLGQSIQKGALLKQRIDVAKLKAGVYFIEVNDGEDIMIKKFIRQ